MEVDKSKDEKGDGSTYSDESTCVPPRTAALFWGICDIKYDPSAAEGQRVRILELGDGQHSRFSGHGKGITERFQSEYILDSVPLRRSVLVENKKVTHDTFVGQGFSNLRPRAQTYLRQYSDELHTKIIADLTLPKNGSVVLKLCNRCRGAGVVVVPVKWLDSALRKLLVPMTDAELDARFKKAEVGPVLNFPTESFHEQCLHWWSNECPVFLAEDCCQSLRIHGCSSEDSGNSDGSNGFDGTLRVAFAICKPSGDEKYGAHEDKEVDKENALEIHMLGGYWKLPRCDATGSEHNADVEVAGETRDQDLDLLEDALQDARRRVVSSFNSTEKRTASVSPEHLLDVYRAVRKPILQVIGTGNVTVELVNANYKADILFRAYMLARLAANLRPKESDKAEERLETARRLVEHSNLLQKSGNLAWRSCISYIERISAVCLMTSKQSLEAARACESSISWMPTNASAYYVEGRCCVEGSKYQGTDFCLTSACASVRKALSLDPDFRYAYVALGSYQLRLGKFMDVIESQEACLVRYPDTPAAYYNLGTAIFHLLKKDATRMEKKLVKELGVKGVNALRTAKMRFPHAWKANDEQKLLSLEDVDTVPRKPMPSVPVNTWLCPSWRP